MAADPSIARLAAVAAGARPELGPRLPGLGDELAASLRALVPDQDPADVGEVLLLISSLVANTSALLGGSEAKTAEQLGTELAWVLGLAGERLYGER